jgi:Ser/Thr protein kinase RdoA (MazF antagonist)
MSRGALGVSLERILAHVRERAREYFPEIEAVAGVRTVETHHRTRSEVYRVAIDDGRGGSYEVVIKISEDAAVQFQAMTDIWPHFASHPTWKIPRPLDCLAEGRAMVVGKVPGIPLPACLPRIAWAGRSLRAAEAACGRAGQWLRFYHDLAAKEERRPLDVPAKLDGLARSLRELERAGFDSRTCCTLAERIGPLADRLHRQPLPISHVHGDFSADNVLIDDRQVTVLDLCAIDRDAAIHDIASFLNSLLLLRLTRFVPSSALRRLQEAFLGGYFGSERPQVTAIAALQAIGLVDVTLEILGRRGSAAARAWMEHVFTGGLETITCLGKTSPGA